MGSASESTSNGWEPSTAAHVWAHESVIQKYLQVTRRMAERIILSWTPLMDSLRTRRACFICPKGDQAGPRT